MKEDDFVSQQKSCSSSAACCMVWQEKFRRGLCHAGFRAVNATFFLPAFFAKA
jgi:hypothetical protein